MPKDTFEVTQPWVTYHYPYTDRQATLRGLVAKVEMSCAVCGDREDWTVRIGRRPKQDARGYAVERSAFLAAHAHPDRVHPMSWAQPLRNPAAHQDGIDADLLAMRLQADLNEKAGG